MPKVGWFKRSDEPVIVQNLSNGTVSLTFLNHLLSNPNPKRKWMHILNSNRNAGKIKDECVWKQLRTIPMLSSLLWSSNDNQNASQMKTSQSLTQDMLWIHEKVCLRAFDFTHGPLMLGKNWCVDDRLIDWNCKFFGCIFSAPLVELGLYDCLSRIWHLDYSWPHSLEIYTQMC